MTDLDSEAELRRQLQAGDQAALDSMALEHRSYLRKVIESRLDDRLASRVDASDLIQETLLEAYRRVQNENADPPMPLRLWLRQIAIDRIRMAERRHLHTKKRGAWRELVLPDRSSIILAHQLWNSQSPERRPEERLAQGEIIAAVRKSLAELSEVDREILTMRTFEDLSYEEIEIVIGVSAVACRKRYGRALLRLSKLLDAFSDSSD
jgi:RNA polymerase sigma-70 factor (ECF subfamily)